MIGDRKSLSRYMREKFFDLMHIDSAINAGADIFLTIDFKLLRSIESHPEFQKWLARKIKVLTPYELMKVKVSVNHCTIIPF